MTRQKLVLALLVVVQACTSSPSGPDATGPTNEGATSDVVNGSDAVPVATTVPKESPSIGATTTIAPVDGEQPSVSDDEPAVTDDVVAPTEQPTMFRVEPSLSSTAQSIEQFDRLGAEGYAFVGPLLTGSFSEVGNIFVRAATRFDSTLDYATAEAAPDAGAWLQSANALGADGFLAKGPYLPGDGQVELFVRDTTQPRVLRYEVRAASLSLSADEVVAELNEHGARGFRWLGSRIFGVEIVNIFAADDGGAIYSYESVPVEGPLATNDIDEFLAILNERAATYVTTLAVNNLADTVLVFESSSAEVAAVSFTAEPVATTSGGFDALITAVNQRAEIGELFVGEVMMNDFTQHRLYRSGSADVRHPLTGPWYP